MNSGLANGQHLGVSLAYYANGQTSFHNVGFVDLQKTIPISEDKLFEIASLGKVFTAILFVKLFERRLCSADDLVSKYVPELSHLSVLTLTHLLTHTGGLPREPADFVSIAPKNSFAAYDESKLIATLNSSLHLLETLGSFSYSNFGYIILGLIAKRLTNQSSFSDLCMNEVVADLGLSNTCYELSKQRADTLCSGFDPEGTEVRYINYGAFESAGGAKSSVSDLIKVASQTLDALESKDGTPLEQLTQLYPSKGPSEVALGWHVRRHKGFLCYFHPGGLAGVKSSIVFCPKLNRAISYISNSASHVRIVWDLLIPEGSS